MNTEDKAIRPFDIFTDSERICELWNIELRDKWPMDRKVFLKMVKTGGISGSFVALKDGTVAGFPFFSHLLAYTSFLPRNIDMKSGMLLFVIMS